MTTPSHVHAAIDLESRDYLGLIDLAGYVLASMGGQPGLFVAPTVSLATLASQTEDLIEAQKAANNRTRGAAAFRNGQARVVRTSLRSLQAYVQGLVDALSHEDGIVLILAAGLKVAASTAHTKALLAAKLGARSGEVFLAAHAGLLSASKRRKRYAWQYTLDGVTFVDAGPSLYAHTTVTGLPPLTTVGFRVCVIVGDDAPGPWTQVVRILVL
jgi:hypothetical protein